MSSHHKCRRNLWVTSPANLLPSLPSQRVIYYTVCEHQLTRKGGRYSKNQPYPVPSNSRCGFCFPLPAMTSFSSLDMDPSTFFRVGLHISPKPPHWPYLPLLYFPSETRLSYLKNVKSKKDFKNNFSFRFVFILYFVSNLAKHWEFLQYSQATEKMGFLIRVQRVSGKRWALLLLDGPWKHEGSSLPESSEIMESRTASVPLEQWCSLS